MGEPPHSDAAMGNREIFDRASLLDRLSGDEDLCKELLDAFLEDMPIQLDRLNQAAAEGDLGLVKRQAHTIKGASANIGAQALSRVAFEVEMAARDGRLDRVSLSCGNLADTFERLRQFLSDADVPTDHKSDPKRSG
jgi:HPt (histidine-containing phosphotransfer) domain-containing protein